MRFLRFFGKALLISLFTFFAFLCVVVFCRAQPTQKVRIELKESKDRFGTRCIDVYLENRTTKSLVIDENILRDYADGYGGMWNNSLKSNIIHCYLIEWWRRDLEYAKKYPNYGIHGCGRMPPMVRVFPGQKKRVSSVYVLPKPGKSLEVTSIQLGYQPGKELSYWSKVRFFRAEFFDKIFEFFPLHHVLLSRKIYWSNRINVVPIQKSEIRGIDQDFIVGSASSSV
jgi:hypothetical protein